MPHTSLVANDVAHALAVARTVNVEPLAACDRNNHSVAHDTAQVIGAHNFLANRRLAPPEVPSTQTAQLSDSTTDSRQQQIGAFRRGAFEQKWLPSCPSGVPAKHRPAIRTSGWSEPLKGEAGQSIPLINRYSDPVGGLTPWRVRRPPQPPRVDANSHRPRWRDAPLNPRRAARCATFGLLRATAPCCPWVRWSPGTAVRHANFRHSCSWESQRNSARREPVPGPGREVRRRLRANAGCQVLGYTISAMSTKQPGET